MSTAPFHVFAKGILAIGAKLDNLGSDTIDCLLMTSAYNPSGVLATAEYVHDVTTAGGTEVSNGNGYTTGGASCTGTMGWAVTVANSWGTTWAASTAYSVGALVRPSTGNTYIYQAVAAGTSGSSFTFGTTVGETTSDNTVVWLNIGTSVTVLGAAASTFTWTSSGAGFSAAYGIVYDSTPGSYTTDPVIGYYDFGGTLSATGGGLLTINVPSSGILAFGSS